MPKMPPPAVDPLPGPDIVVITAVLVLLMMILGIVWAVQQ